MKSSCTVCALLMGELMMMMMLIEQTLSFGVKPLSSLCSTTTATTVSATVRKKETMAEKRARRKARQQKTLNLPKRPQKVTLVEEEQQQEPVVNNNNDPASQKQASATQTKAQALIERQRKSVATLTLVKESIEKIPSQELAQALEQQGYFVWDNFLNHQDNINKTILHELQQEGITLMNDNENDSRSGSMMIPDMDNLASGEYIGALKGGEEQYKICPRSIEWVVSTTKHFATVVDPTVMELDTGNCMGTMRTFDRKAFEAAKALLIAKHDKNDDKDSQKNQEDDVDDDNAISAPFRCLVDTNDTSDQRRLSLRYYLVPLDWKFGGGIEFEHHGLVEARRDRLVVWKSAKTAFRNEPWKGDESHRFGSRLELDLIQRKQESKSA